MEFLAAVYMTVALSHPAFECKPLKVLFKELLSEKRVAYLSDAIDDHDNVLFWFVNPHTGEWYEVGVLPDAETGCIIFHGFDYRFAYEKGA